MRDQNGKYILEEWFEASEPTLDKMVDVLGGQLALAFANYDHLAPISVPSAEDIDLDRIAAIGCEIRADEPVRHLNTMIGREKRRQSAVGLIFEDVPYGMREAAKLFARFVVCFCQLSECLFGPLLGGGQAV